MKFLSRVVWSEGMYLAPHHFQTQSRYFEDSVRFAMEHTWYEPWGLLHYRLDEDAIKNGRVSLQSAHGIFKDGLAFAMPDDPLPAERDIREVFPTLSESLIIYLAIPERQETLPSCDLQAVSTSARYHAVERDVRDINNGTNERKVKFCQKNIRLLAEPEISHGMLSIPLARVKRDGSGHLMYDPEFIPPCIRLSASPRLMAILDQLTEVLEEKRKKLAQTRGKQGNFQSGIGQSDVSIFWFMHAINDGLAVLRHYCRSKRGHPEEIFRELSRMAGALCTFSSESDPGALPLYDHYHLGDCFQSLAAHILEHLEILVHSNVIDVPIRRVEPNLYIGKISDQRGLGRSRWVLGVGSSAGEAKVITHGASLMKVCSRKFVGELVRRAVPGLELIHLPAPPSAISARPDLQYFSISQAGPCWNHITETREIGIYIPNELPEADVELHIILGS